MSLAVSGDDWPDIDKWWQTFSRDQQPPFTADYSRAIAPSQHTKHWPSVDAFWDSLEMDYDSAHAPQHISAVMDAWDTDAWLSVDEFWEAYAAQQRPQLEELQALLADVQARWTASDSRFDADPLTADWTATSQYNGPLRRGVNEEDWSHWLAHLLRTSTGALPVELFDTPHRSPTRVRREVQFTDTTTIRRADILVEFPETAVSIEVKIGDPNYGKTPETAALIEQQDNQTWTHTLLMQQANIQRLTRNPELEVDVPTDGRPTIHSADYPEIEVQVIYWQDISRVLRQLLWTDAEPDTHWAASAYTFITLIEQRLLNFHSISEILPRNTRTHGTPGSPDHDSADAEEATQASTALDFHQLVAVEPTDQIAYVESLLEEALTHE